MFYRVLIASIVAVCLCMAQPSWAQGNGNGSGNSSENGNGGGNSGDNGGGPGGGNGNGGGNGGSGNGGAGNSDNGGSSGSTDNAADRDRGSNAGGQAPSEPAAPGTLTQSEPAPVPLSASEEAALGAVQSGRAVPLTTIVTDIQGRGAGQVIDAQLVQSEQFLLYAIKVLSDAGRVTTEYYYARTGQRVEVR